MRNNHEKLIQHSGCHQGTY